MCYSVFNLVNQTVQAPVGPTSQYGGDKQSVTPPTPECAYYSAEATSPNSSGYSSYNSSPTRDVYTLSPEYLSEIESLSPNSLPEIFAQADGEPYCAQQAPSSPYGVKNQCYNRDIFNPYNGCFFNYPQTTEGMDGKLLNHSLQQTLCKVCGDTASGNHFGILSCEACKSFFRRSIRSSARYACRGTRGCAIEKHTRNRCQYCRLQKCMAIGMRKEGNVSHKY